MMLRNALKERIKAMSPEQKKSLLRNLIDFACDADEYRDMPIEQVEAELREAGFTDEDFDRMNKRINAILKKYASPAPPTATAKETNDA